VPLTGWGAARLCDDGRDRPLSVLARGGLLLGGPQWSGTARLRQAERRGVSSLVSGRAHAATVASDASWQSTDLTGRPDAQRDLYVLVGSADIV
jgi:hypothetical protein